MKIAALDIKNFKAIESAKISASDDMIVIAGPNGSGKSCIFDAIRLFKSVYGSYDQDELRHYAQEFQLSAGNRPINFGSQARDRNQEIEISAEIELSDEEREFIKNEADAVVGLFLFRHQNKQFHSENISEIASYALQMQESEPKFKAQFKEYKKHFLSEIETKVLKGKVTLPVKGDMTVISSLALSILFASYMPGNLGVFDYHGPYRSYSREVLGGINLNVERAGRDIKQSALYNYLNKYKNIKAELAQLYIKDLILEKLSIESAKSSKLTDTLKSLFVTFFPGKLFLGPTPNETGEITFPVKTQDGAIHDLDDLSAGEKEILYGYLRIRNTAPKHSIILIDEPELHLNPRLVRSLPNFYRTHLGKELNNQIWLVTHSDALLREVAGKSGYGVLHMLSAETMHASKKDNQLVPLAKDDKLQAALTDLVGDLASYKPDGKLVLFEGGGDSEFDKQFTTRLFPELAEEANLISGSNKARVRGLHEILSKAADAGSLPFRVYSIVDNDSDEKSVGAYRSPVHFYSWDVYHIENFLLDSNIISLVLRSLGEVRRISPSDIEYDLADCARKSKPRLVKLHLEKHANSLLVGSINLKTDPNALDLVGVLLEAIERSNTKWNGLVEGQLCRQKLVKIAAKKNEDLDSDLATGTWKKTFRGRDILKLYVGERMGGKISYEAIVNLIISEMVNSNFRPAGMATVVRKILRN